MADKEPRQPTHRAYSVIKREGQDDYWLNIGLVLWMVVRIRAKMAQRKKLAWPLRASQPLLAVERLVANDGWVASRVKAVSRRRRGPQARLCVGHARQLGGESPLCNLMEVKH